ncbi:MAG: dual specificity protein phosphatase family protein [Coriobacteriia bacterium]|nr:dual specificity protein phosphatase family protein [Coriobacteriia bacterium]
MGIYQDMDTDIATQVVLSPYDSSMITDQLIIAARPHARHAGNLRSLGVNLVLSTTWFSPPRDLMLPPSKFIRLPMIDFPLFPIPIALLREGVEAALPVLDAGGRVLVHCRAGRHRSVAMACCILIATGMSADDAMALVVARRPIADPHARHIEPRIRAFERDWHSG